MSLSFPTQSQGVINTVCHRAKSAGRDSILGKNRSSKLLKGALERNSYDENAIHKAFMNTETPSEKHKEEQWRSVTK